MKLLKKAKSYIIVIIIVAVMIGVVTLVTLGSENDLANQQVLNDVEAYYHLNKEYPINDEKSKLIQTDLLYGNNVPKRVKRKLDKGYLFYSYHPGTLSSVDSSQRFTDGEIVKVVNVKNKERNRIQDFERNGTVLTWIGPQSGEVYEWDSTKWVYVSDFDSSKFIYADPDKEYAIANYKEFGKAPLLQLQK